MSHEKEFKLFVDGEKFDWDQPTITGAQLRTLASIPQGVQIFQQIPGKPDREVKDSTVANLEDHHGPAKFSTQAPGSSAG
jgi:hypothetical protein